MVQALLNRKSFNLVFLLTAILFFRYIKKNRNHNRLGRKYAFHSEILRELYLIVLFLITKLILSIICTLQYHKTKNMVKHNAFNY